MRSRFRVALVAMVIAGLSAISISQASESCYLKGDKTVQAGIGMGLYVGYGTVFFPPISVVFDYAASDLISVGGGIGFLGSRFDDGWGDVWGYSYLPIMGRIAFHPFNIPSLQASVPLRDQFDAYGGLSVGYTIVTYTEPATLNHPGYSAGASSLTIGLLLGGRWYFNPKWALYAEEGSGFSWLSVGVAMKL
jgi:hypothetical protein